VNPADIERAALLRYSALEGKVVRGWTPEKEAAFKALLIAVGYTADGGAPGDVLDFSDAAWARAEDLIESRSAPATDAERIALHNFNREST
jgi:hypothetical protein